MCVSVWYVPVCCVCTCVCILSAHDNGMTITAHISGQKSEIQLMCPRREKSHNSVLSLGPTGDTHAHARSDAHTQTCRYSLRFRLNNKRKLNGGSPQNEMNRYAPPYTAVTTSVFACKRLNLSIKLH